MAWLLLLLDYYFLIRICYLNIQNLLIKIEKKANEHV